MFVNTMRWISLSLFHFVICGMIPDTTCEQGDGREQDQRELVWLDALGGHVGGGFDSSAHDGPKSTRR